MISVDMISVMHRRRWGIYAAVFGVIAAVVVGLFFLMPKTQAAGDYGDSGTGSGGSGTGYYTSNGFGWKLFDLSGSGPSGGFQSTSWGNVYSRCTATGNNKVWVHVVRNPGGAEKSFTYDGANYNRNRPAAGSDPYVYNSAGNYQNQGPAYQQSVINIVATIQGYYLRVNPSGSGWGVSIGWFCFSDNPPWTVTTTTTANRTSIEPGETVTWTHSIVNNGASVTNRAITWYYQNRGSWPNTAGPNFPTFGSGSAVGARSTQTSSYTALASDFGRQICRSTIASPSANNVNGPTESAALCVTVGKEPKIQIRGGDLVVGRKFVDGAAAASSSVVETSQSIKRR